MKYSFFAVIILIICCVEVHSQNLIANSSFETVTAEPYWGCELTNAVGWLNPSGGPCPTNSDATPDIFSTFSTGQAVLPNSFMGTTGAHTGDRIAGIVTYHDQLTNYREYLMTQLTCPLVPGQTYTVSFWSTGGDPAQYIYHTNNIGIYFSTNALTQSGYNIISGLTPHFEETAVMDNSTWTFYSYTFVPTQAYNYFSLGNFRNDGNTQKQTFGSNRPYAYYFFDDISVTLTGTGTVSVLGNDTAYCAPFTETLSTGNLNTNWSTGATGSQITITAPGTYWASFTSACGYAVSDTIVISTATPLNAFNLGNDTTYCGNFTRILSTGIASTFWSTGLTAPQITVNSIGTYWAQISNACGNVSDTITLSQNIAPAVNLGNDTALCIGQSLLLDAMNSGSSFLWQDNSGNQTYSVSSAGTYSVTVTNFTGCVSTDVITVNFATSLPSVNIGSDTTYCGNFSHILTTNDDSTLWSNGLSGSTISVTNAGWYWADVQNGCGTTRDSVFLTQLTIPPVALPADVGICPGQTINLVAVTSSVNLLWSDGSTGDSININSAGMYWVQVTENGCSNRDSILVNEDITPSFSLGPDTFICGNHFDIELNIPYSQYHWQNNSIDSVYHITTSGIYSVTVTNQCGSLSDDINVDIYSDECALLIPTAFSPNGDGKNDVFRGVCRCPVERYSMEVYNRWGEQVFSTEQVNEGWDGVFRSLQQPLSVYVFHIEYFNYCEQKMKKLVGNVTLVR